MKVILLSLVSVLVFIAFKPIHASNLDSLFTTLEQTMSMREIYDDKKLTRIDNIKTVLAEQDINKVERHVTNMHGEGFEHLACTLMYNLKIVKESYG